MYDELDTLKKYAEENNIKSYLTYVQDLDKLVKLMTVQDYKNMEDSLFDEESFETEEKSYMANLILKYNYLLAVENEDIEHLLELIYECEFDVEINENNKLDLIDMQGAYLGGIDSYDNFDTITDACSRLDGAYFQDYFNLYV